MLKEISANRDEESLAVASEKKRIRLDSFILLVAFLLANLRATIFVYLHPDTSVFLGPAWIEILLWLFLVVTILYDLTHSNQWREYWYLWRLNGLLTLFILLAFVSLGWSIDPLVTWFRALELLLATLVASYVGLRLSPERIMDGLFWFGAVLFILSIALAAGAPPTGTMYWAPFDGAWRGLFWHRNHLASITAFLSIVYLCRVVLSFQRRSVNGILDAILFLLSLVILYFAHSATGFIVFIVLHVALFVSWLWLRLERRLTRRHYALILAGGILMAILILTNLDSVFGLFGRDSSMTGRVGLWSHLLELASRWFWFGHGFGVVWTLDSFRSEIQQLAGWPSQPLIADNGLLDIFLHLGVTGVLILIGVLILATVRSLRYGIKQKTITGFFPLLVMVYAFFANITFSLFAETEVFVWFLIITVLFMTAAGSKKATTL
jgi:exopolysaccharide production protein ExoQ